MEAIAVEAVAVQGQQDEHSGGVGVGEAVDRPGLLAEQPGRFSEHRPAGQERRGQFGEGLDAEAVAAI